MLCRILLAVSWSGEVDCAKTADNARNRMRIDVKGLVNTAEPVPVFRFKEETGLRGFESGDAEVQARYIAGTT
ncbi:MAG: hypothetical protein OXH11_08960 [Candidatus Aminicenantes bacterium]|nr:hypothetical protein [Candidatus Aminicenantes bacterium]